MKYIKVLEYVHDQYPVAPEKPFRLGYAVVEADDGLTIVNVNISQHGHVYLGFTSACIKGEWRKARELKYRATENSYFREILRQIVSSMPKEYQMAARSALESKGQEGAKESVLGQSAHAVIDPEYQQDTMPF